MQQVHVRKNAIGEARLVDCDQGKLADDAVRLEIESFSVTANNVTYAVVGDGFGYWNFFPVQGAGTDGMGIVPMWGHARVIESNVSEISVGERVYGYLPMATHLDVVPGKLSASGFTDMAAHRQPMSPVYNSYSRLAADPEHDPAREGERMIFGPLFKTGFLIEYFMRSQDWFGAEQVILTSASSKTAMGLASTARHRSPDIRRTMPGRTGKAHGSLGRCAGQDYLFGAEPVLRAHEVFDQETGLEQRTEDHPFAFARRIVFRVGCKPRIAVVDRAHRLAMCGHVGKAAGGQFSGHDVQMRRHRQVAIDPLAHGYLGHIAFDDACMPPHGHYAHAVGACPLHGEEVPVSEAVADDRIGHVVRRDREAFDFQAHRIVGQLSLVAIDQSGLADCILADMDLLHSRLSFESDANRRSTPMRALKPASA